MRLGSETSVQVFTLEPNVGTTNMLCEISSKIEIGRPIDVIKVTAEFLPKFGIGQRRFMHRF